MRFAVGIKRYPALGIGVRVSTSASDLINSARSSNGLCEIRCTDCEQTATNID